jgi:hypothetical protein
MEYYVFADEATANQCIGAINGTDWFPIVGNRNGVPDPTAQQTTCWCEAGQEMKSGEWAVPKIPDARLDYVGVPQEEREAFLAVFGQDIRDLTADDFPAPPEGE